MINFFKKFNKKNKLNSGFTLVETLVAISIFTTSIIALMSVLASGISNTNYAKKKMIAGYLAQEGIEYVRSIRDTAVLSATSGTVGWNNFINTMSPCLETGCYFSAEDLIPISSATQFEPCSSDGCPVMYYDSVTGKYNYDTVAGVDSGLIRMIKVETEEGGNSLNQGNEVKVSSTVSWKQGSGDYSVTFSEYLFNWIEQ